MIRQQRRAAERAETPAEAIARMPGWRMCTGSVVGPSGRHMPVPSHREFARVMRIFWREIGADAPSLAVDGTFGEHCKQMVFVTIKEGASEEDVASALGSWIAADRCGITWADVAPKTRRMAARRATAKARGV